MKIKSILRYKKNRRGFTIVELLITIAILGIIAGIAMPPLLRARINSMLRDDTFTLIADMERAKMEAIRRNRNVTLDFNWDARTYTVYIDANTNNTFDNNDILIIQGDFHRSTQFDPAPSINRLVFNSRGAIRNATEPASFTLTNSRDSYTVSANRLGFITSKHISP